MERIKDWAILIGFSVLIFGGLAFAILRTDGLMALGVFVSVSGLSGLLLWVYKD
jgi:hypothetical protein